MEHDFWHQRWQQGRIGFHRSAPQPLLERYWADLDSSPGGTVLVPLCGKSLDLAWLVEQGHSVLGVELSELACRQFFEEQQRPVKVVDDVPWLRFESDRLALLCGDVFGLEAAQLAAIDAVYDRAALIALPPAMRQRYAQLLCERLPAHVKVLLITLEFEGEQGPPFSVSQAEVEQLFGARFSIERLHQQADDKPGVNEVTYRLLPR